MCGGQTPSVQGGSAPPAAGHQPGQVSPRCGLPSWGWKAEKGEKTRLEAVSQGTLLNSLPGLLYQGKGPRVGQGKGEPREGAMILQWSEPRKPLPQGKCRRPVQQLPLVPTRVSTSLLAHIQAAPPRQGSRGCSSLWGSEREIQSSEGAWTQETRNQAPNLCTATPLSRWHSLAYPCASPRA